jgi:DNA-binding transcriptional ArsR family regulator
MTDPEFAGIQLDERAIRVLAHPLRSRLLGQLRMRGPATATELAAELSTNTGATSYHLRALESVGLVADTGEGVGKRRVWRATTQYHSWTNSAFRDDDDTRTALEWLQRNYVRQFAERAERWLDAADGWSADWVDRLGLSDALITVTPEQLAAFDAELDELVARYRLIGDGDPRARRVHLSHFARPVELDPPAEA